MKINCHALSMEQCRLLSSIFIGGVHQKAGGTHKTERISGKGILIPYAFKIAKARVEMYDGRL
jgi:hypothetical protein